MAKPPPANGLSFLVAELDLGLTFVHMSARAEDAWLAARQLAKAEQAYDTVLRLRERIEIPEDARADLWHRLEELRLAIQGLSRVRGSVRH